MNLSEKQLVSKISLSNPLLIDSIFDKIESIIKQTNLEKLAFH
jgi:hypothetical protein